MAKKAGLTRRDFLATSTQQAAALGVGSVLLTRTAASAKRTLGANDRITIGLIGSGGRGTGDAQSACTASNVVCVGVCDVAEFRLDNASHVLSKAMAFKGHKDVKIDRHHDYRELLDRKDIDAVVIATPDVWHYAPFLAAVEAGKHIYQEKPFSYTIEQGLEMVAAAQKRPELTIQVGTQRRSGSHNLQAKAFIDEGKLGDVRFVRSFDCRNWITGRDPFSPQSTAQRVEKNIGRKIDWKTAKIDWDKFQEPCGHKVPFDPWRYCAWRWYWDYAGGLVTDVGVHVMDNIHWLLGEPTPKSAVCNGGVYALEYWETPDVVNAVWDYGHFSAAFTSNFTNGFQGDGFIIYGTRATLDARGGDIKIWEEGNRDKPLQRWPRKGVAHQHNWIDAIRSGERPNAPVELGHSSLLPSHLANLAYRKGTKVRWDPATQKAV